MPEYEIEYGGQKYGITYNGNIDDVVKALPKIMPQVLGKLGKPTQPSAYDTMVAQLRTPQPKQTPFMAPQAKTVAEDIAKRAIPVASATDVKTAMSNRGVVEAQRNTERAAAQQQRNQRNKINAQIWENLLKNEPPVLAKWLPAMYPPGADAERVMWERRLMEARGMGEENLPTVKELGPLAYLPGVPELMAERHPSASQRIAQLVLEQLTPEGMATNIAAGGLISRVPAALRTRAFHAAGLGFGGGSIASGVQRMNEGDVGAGAVDIGFGALLAGLPFVKWGGSTQPETPQIPEQTPPPTPQTPPKQWYDVEPTTQPTNKPPSPERVLPRKAPPKPPPPPKEPQWYEVQPTSPEPKPSPGKPERVLPRTPPPVPRSLPRKGRKVAGAAEPEPPASPDPNAHMEPPQPQTPTPPDTNAQQPTIVPDQPQGVEPAQKPAQQGVDNAIPKQEATPGVLRDQGVGGEGGLQGVGQEVKGPEPSGASPETKAKQGVDVTTAEKQPPHRYEPDIVPDDTGRTYRTEDGDVVELDVLDDLGPRNESMYKVADALKVDIPRGPKRPPLHIVRYIADHYMAKDPTILDKAVEKAKRSEPLKAQEAIVLMSEAVNAAVRATKAARRLTEAARSGKTTPDELAALADDFEQAKTAFQEIETANRMVGSRTSFMLNMRRIRISDENLPSHRIAEYMARTKGKITPDEITKIETLTKEEIAARNEADALDRDLWNYVEDGKFWRETAYHARRVSSAAEKRRILQQLKDIWTRCEPYGETLNATPKEIVDFAKDVARSAQLLAELGTKSAADALEILFNRLGPKYPNITKSMMAQVLADGPETITAGRAKEIAMRARLEQLRQSRAEAEAAIDKSLEKLEHAGEQVKKQIQDDIEAKQKERAEKAKIKRLERQIATLERRINAGEFEPKPREPRGEETHEVQALRAKIKELQDQIKANRKAQKDAEKARTQEARPVKNAEERRAQRLAEAGEKRLERKIAELEAKIEKAKQGTFEEETVRKVRELSERERQLRKRARALATEYEHIKQSNEPESYEQWLQRYRMTNMLSSLATQTLNITSNVINLSRLETTRIAEEALAGRNDLPRRIIGLHDGLRIGVANARQILQQGFAPSHLPEGIVPPREFRGGGRNPYNWVGRAMRAADAIFFETARQAEISSLAGKLGTTPEERLALRMNPTEEMVAQADRYAREVVFRIGKDDKTLASETATAIDAGKAQSATFRRIMDWGLPFYKIALEITRQGVNLTPGVRALQMLKESNRSQWRRAVVDTSIGSAALLAGYSLYQQGRFTLGYPRDKIEKMQWNNLKKEPYSVYIGGRWVSMQYLGPMVIPFVLGAALGEATEHHKRAPKASWVKDVLINNAVYNATSYGKGLTQTSPLTSINAITDALSGDRPSGTVRLPANIIGQLMPLTGMSASIAKVVDRTVRDPEDTSLIGVWQTLLTRVPFASESVPPKKDVPKRSPDVRERILNYMITRSGAGKASPSLKSTLTPRPKPPSIDELLRMPTVMPNIRL